MKKILVIGMMLLSTSAFAGQQCGIASVYSTHESGSRTASGVRLNNGAMTAAHRSLRFGTRVHLCGTTVTITDRGPFVKGRIIDLTPAAARVCGFSGLRRVCITW